MMYAYSLCEDFKFKHTHSIISRIQLNNRAAKITLANPNINTIKCLNHVKSMPSKSILNLGFRNGVFQNKKIMRLLAQMNYYEIQ